ncbi:MAG: ATP-binding protein [Caldilineaceae bacterium]
MGIADYRNPKLAETMRVLGFVRRFGVGIQIARAELAKNGQREPEFELSSQHVICRVYPRTAEEIFLCKFSSASCTIHACRPFINHNSGTARPL